MAARGTMPVGRDGTRAGGVLAAAALTLLLVVACESNVPGIFHTLATENERDNRNLHDDLTVSAVAAVDDTYYVAAHGMWSRPARRDSWQAVARPRRGSIEQPVLAMAQSGGTLCVGTEDGVYHAAADPKSPRWRPAAGVAGQIVRLFAIPRREQEILAITADHEVYRSIDDCANFDNVTPDDASGRPFDASYVGERYWLTVGRTVYSGESLSSLAPDTPDTPDTREGTQPQFRGILCLDRGGRCLFATADGEVYEHVRNRWVRLGKIEPPDDDAPPVPLTLFIEIDGQILVGTRGYGFYQFAEQDQDLDNVRRGPRSTSQLYRAHVTMFIRHGDLVFAGTAGDGLSSIEVATAAKDTGTWDWE